MKHEYQERFLEKVAEAEVAKLDPVDAVLADCRVRFPNDNLRWVVRRAIAAERNRVNAAMRHRLKAIPISPSATKALAELDAAQEATRAAESKLATELWDRWIILGNVRLGDATHDQLVEARLSAMSKRDGFDRDAQWLDALIVRTPTDSTPRASISLADALALKVSIFPPELYANAGPRAA